MRRSLLLATLVTFLSSNMAMAAEHKPADLSFTNDITTGHSVLVRVFAEDKEKEIYWLVDQKCIRPGHAINMEAIIGVNNRFEVMVQKQIYCEQAVVYEESYEMIPEGSFLNGKILRADDGSYQIRFSKL